MKVPEVLRRPKDLRKEMERKQMRIETLRRFARQLTAPLQEVKIKSSPDPARFQALLAEAADEEKDLKRLEAERTQAVTEAVLAFSALPDERMIRMMELRYLEERSWEEIAQELWISQSRMFKLHRAAVAALCSNEQLTMNN